MPLPTLTEQLQRLISLPSISSCSPQLDQSNLAVIEQLAQWLGELGFQCDIQPLHDNPKKANLLATLGSGPGGLVLAGHTDTVPFDEGRWQTDPFKLTERNHRFYGLGTSDMKGFFATAIEAIKGYQAKDFQQPLIILATADEESSMQGARELAESGRPKARYAIVGEPTNLRPMRMHKGILLEKVTVFGQSGHSSNPSLGINALEVMHEVMTDLMSYRHELQQRYHSEAFDVPSPTLNLGCIHGGDNPNRICGKCELQFDLRGLPGMENQELRTEISERVQQIAQRYGTKIDYSPLVLGSEAYEESKYSELVKMAEQFTGHTAGAVAFATEAPFFQSLGMQTIVMGPGSIDVAHQPDEFMELQQIEPCVKLLRQFIEKCCLTSASIDNSNSTDNN